MDDKVQHFKTVFYSSQLNCLRTYGAADNLIKDDKGMSGMFERNIRIAHIDLNDFQVLLMLIEQQ